jgi:hypothetical protein
MIPREFRPFRTWPSGLDDQARADWLLAQVDEDPRRHTALVAMPVADNDEQLDEYEEDFRRAFELARTTGRRLAVLHGLDTNGPTPGASRIGLLLHEHKFVGGLCVHGCRDTEEAA